LRCNAQPTLSGVSFPLFFVFQGSNTLCRQILLLLSRDPVLHELGRRHLAERGVATTPVIKYFDVFKQVRNRVSMRGVPSFVNSFVLQAVEEAFSWGIVPTISFAAHRTCHSVLGELLLKGMTGVLAATDALLNVKLVCHFSECKAARFRGAVAGCPPPAGAVVVVGDRAGQPWTTRDPPTHVQITNACLLSGTGRFHATWT